MATQAISKKDGKWIFPKVEDDPRYKPVFERLKNVRQKLSGLEGRIAQIERDRTAAEQSRMSEVDAKAAAMLRGEAVPVVTALDFTVDLEKLRAEKRVAERAVKQGEAELQQVLQEIYGEILQAAAPEYRKVIRAQTNAVFALARAVLAEDEFRGELKSYAGNHFTGTIFPMVISHAAAFFLHQEWAWINSIYLRELLEHGYLTPAEAKELRAGGMIKE